MYYVASRLDSLRTQLGINLTFAVNATIALALAYELHSAIIECTLSRLIVVPIFAARVGRSLWIGC